MKTQLRFYFCAVFLFFSVHAWSQTYIVKTPSTQVYESPSSDASKIGVIPKGKKVFATAEENGFVQLTTKSGRAMWVSHGDLEVLADISEDVVDAKKTEEKPNTETQTEVADEKEDKAFTPHLTWDLSISGGNYQNYSYTEGQLGFNLFFTKYLVWRNAPFARFSSLENYYGLDTSGRFVFSPEILTVFAGPGYRFVSKGNSVPFVEAGLAFHVSGFNIGGGFKTLLHSTYDKKASNDTQYFIILSGAGSF